MIQDKDCLPLGQAAEVFTRHYLEARGLTFLEQNARFRCGEIDLIMRDGETLVFVEVRLRTTKGFAAASESVTWRKQEKIRRAAAAYLQKHPYNCPCRFDVFAITPTAKCWSVEWIINAFD